MIKTFTCISFLLIVTINCVSAQPPANYYNAATGKTCSELKTALKNIISVVNAQSYNDLWNQYELTDVKNREVGTGSAKVIYDIYSDKPGPNNDPYNFTPGTGNGGQQDQGGGGNTEGLFYNREHSIPLSWFGGSTSAQGPGSDYNHIFPTDKKVNGMRGNMPYGEVGNASFTSLNGSKIGSSAVAGITGSVFEPIDSFKGDVARAFLYFVTRYEDNMPGYAGNAEAVQAFEPNTYPSVDIPFLQLMIGWHHLDPVSAKEVTRNNGTYSYQGNRNPYIDHPEYVDLVWKNTCTGLVTLPVDIVFFGGKLTGGQVVLEWKTANEAALDRYEVERSFNGTTYRTIAELKAANATAYTFSDNGDENRGRQVFYRLKKVDKDGHFNYSAVLTLHIPLNTRFAIYPNPATTFIQLKMNRSINGKVTVQVMDITGKVLLQDTEMINGNDIRIPVDKLSAGTYLVKLLYEGEQYVQKVIVVK